MTPILLIGAGHMGGALVAGWRRAGAFPMHELAVRDPSPGPQALQSGANAFARRQPATSAPPIRPAPRSRIGVIVAL